MTCGSKIYVRTYYILKHILNFDIVPSLDAQMNVVLDHTLQEFGTLPIAKYFAECFFGTRQKSSLPSVKNKTLDKELFAKCFFSTLDKNNLKITF
jgi:hypothetical protein